jgi:aminoglycoside 3-N-acetyltransferase
MGRINSKMFRKWFEEIITPRDEIVVVYSGIWTFGHKIDVAKKDVPRMLIESMLEAVGSHRTLVLPSYTYSFASNRLYSPAATIPENGILPQFMFLEFDCKRSISALNSFLAIGPKAQLIAEIRGETLWGEGSLKHYFEQNHARMVTLGIPWKDSLGFLHRIEESSCVPYRYFKTFNGYWQENGISKPWKETMYVRSKVVEPIFAWSRVDELLKSRSKILSSVGPILIESADASEIVSAGNEIISENPYALLSNEEEVQNWVVNNKEEEIALLRKSEPFALDWYDNN